MSHGLPMYKLHTGRPCSGTKPGPSCCEATVITTAFLHAITGKVIFLNRDCETTFSSCVVSSFTLPHVAAVMCGLSTSVSLCYCSLPAGLSVDFYHEASVPVTAVARSVRRVRWSYSCELDKWTELEFSRQCQRELTKQFLTEAESVHERSFKQSWTF